MKAKTLNTLSHLEKYQMDASLLSNIVMQMPGYIYWKDCDSNYLGCNWNLANLSGLNSPDDIIGMSDEDFTWGYGQADQFKQDDKKVITSQKKHVSEYQLPVLRKDGHWLSVRTEKLPLYDQAENVIGVLAIALDITDQKLLHEEIINITEKANIATQIKTEFLANMSHDLRTPLCGIQGAAEILKNYNTQDTKLNFAINALHDCSQRLCDCIDNIANFQRIYQNDNTLRNECFELKNALRSLVNEYQIQLKDLEKHNVQLKLRYAKNVPSKVITDGAIINRIMMNLLQNAIKFTEQGQIIVAVNISEKNLIFTVKDTGCGIPANKKDIIFDRFSRLTPSYQGQTPGQGLGLTMVKHLLNQLGGHIQLESEIGKGTVFILFIPIEFESSDDPNSDQNNPMTN